MASRGLAEITLRDKWDGLFSWLRLGLWLALIALALVLAASLAGFNASDALATGGAVKNLLGPAGAAVAWSSLNIMGLASWLLVALLPLFGWLYWKGAGRLAVLPLMCGALWTVVGLITICGLSGVDIAYKGARITLGGSAGRVAAQSLRGLAGAQVAWAVAVVVAVCGLGLMLYCAWPILSEVFVRWLRETKPRKAAGEQAEPAAQKAAPKPSPAPKMAKEKSRAKPKFVAPAAKPQATVQKARPRQSSNGRFSLPPLDLLSEARQAHASIDREELMNNSRLLEAKLGDFGVEGRVSEVATGPVVTMYEFKPAPGVKISKVAGLADDLALNLRAQSIRIVAPIPGKAAIGIEIPNAHRDMVCLRELLSSAEYDKSASPLTTALGKDILGFPLVDDLCRMPHLLIAGATGAGKSVFINTMILSVLYKSTPDEVRLIMVDPKRIELSTYNEVPHLLHPIITSPKEATAGLRWAVTEMERRYSLLADLGVRNIKSFNKKLRESGLMAEPDGGLGGTSPDPERPARLTPLPHILIIIDELADLMMVSSKEVEALITRLAQMARAAGIHLVLATQRPSVDVITGLIKANFPARISFQVSSRIDSRTILDQQGAEHLLGAGDMLFLHPSNNGPKRAHGAFVSDSEIERVVDFWKDQAQPNYDESIVRAANGDEDEGDMFGGGDEIDEHYQDAVRIVKQSGKASVSFVQRKLRVGYNRAARMIEQMEIDGIVGPSDGSKPRQVLVRD